MDVNIYMGCIRILLCVLSFGWNKLWTVTNNKKSILNDLNFAALLFTCESEALDQFLPQSFELHQVFYYSFEQKSHLERKHLKTL